MRSTRLWSRRSCRLPFPHAGSDMLSALVDRSLAGFPLRVMGAAIVRARTRAKAAPLCRLLPPVNAFTGGSRVVAEFMVVGSPPRVRTSIS